MGKEPQIAFIYIYFDYIIVPSKNWLPARILYSDQIKRKGTTLDERQTT